MQDYIRTLRMLNSTGTSYLDNISYMYYLYDSLGRLTLQGGILLPAAAGYHPSKAPACGFAPAPHGPSGHKYRYNGNRKFPG